VLGRTMAGVDRRNGLGKGSEGPGRRRERSSTTVVLPDTKDHVLGPETPYLTSELTAKHVGEFVVHLIPLIPLMSLEPLAPLP